jgi:adenylate kinase family enzyme
VKKRVPAVVFVFGGPNSCKGTIVDNIVSTYGFHHINICDIIRAEFKNSHLTHEYMCSVKINLNTCDMNWVVDMLLSRMERNSHAAYIIDLVPNLRVSSQSIEHL